MSLFKIQMLQQFINNNRKIMTGEEVLIINRIKIIIKTRIWKELPLMQNLTNKIWFINKMKIKNLLK
jgi:hypothetical protein